MANPKNTIMQGRKFARPTARKFGGGEIVTTKSKEGLGKKWIVENDSHLADRWTASKKHSYYRCRRGAWVKYFRSDKLSVAAA